MVAWFVCEVLYGDLAMKQKLLVCFCVIMLSASSAWAAGIGFYGTGGVGTQRWTGSGRYGMSYVGWSTLDSTTTDKPTGRTTCYGGGFVYDTAVASNTLLNYRLKAGYERTFIHFNGSSDFFHIPPPPNVYLSGGIYV